MSIKSTIKSRCWGKTHGLFMAAEHCKQNGLKLLGHLTINSQNIEEREKMFLNIFEDIMTKVIAPSELQWGILETQYQLIIAFHLPGEKPELASFYKKIKECIAGQENVSTYAVICKV